MTGSSPIQDAVYMPYNYPGAIKVLLSARAITIIWSFAWQLASNVEYW